MPRGEETKPLTDNIVDIFVRATGDSQVVFEQTNSSVWSVGSAVPGDGA
jgi:hypothetical protein